MACIADRVRDVPALVNGSIEDVIHVAARGEAMTPCHDEIVMAIALPTYDVRGIARFGVRPRIVPQADKAGSDPGTPKSTQEGQSGV